MAYPAFSSRFTRTWSVSFNGEGFDIDHAPNNLTLIDGAAASKSWAAFACRTQLNAEATLF